MCESSPILEHILNSWGTALGDLGGDTSQEQLAVADGMDLNPRKRGQSEPNLASFEAWKMRGKMSGENDWRAWIGQSFDMSFADPFSRSSHFFSQFDCRNAFRMQRAVGVCKHNFVAPWKRTLLHPKLRKEYRWSGSQRVLPKSLRIFIYHAYITYTPKSSILIGFSIHTKFVVITPPRR